MTIVHVVLFKFLPTTPDAVIKQALDDAAALKLTCLHPITNLPYIKSFKAGKDNNKEGLQKGFTHLFVMEFENIKDRDYYVSQDQAHQAYIQMVRAIPIGEVQVLDFEEGCY